MKNIIPFKKEILFKTNIEEITSISLEHTLSIEELKVEGNFILSGEYKQTDSSEYIDKFSYKIPFLNIIEDTYNTDEAVVDIEDFYYEIINQNILSISIDVKIDNLKEKEIDVRNIEIQKEETEEIINEAKEEKQEVKKETPKEEKTKKAVGAELNKTIEKMETSAVKKHILVVDDSGTMLRTIKEWLSDKYKVSVVNSATSAISFLATNHPDLVLLDYEMPICSGPMMLEMIRSEAKTQKLPVIFLTSKGDRESVQKVLSLHPDGYLLKTMSSDKIIAAIDGFFETQKAKKI